jgi:hypothetical protein
MLAWLNAQPILEQREMASSVGSTTSAMVLTRLHHNQVGIGAGWVTQHMLGSPRAQAASEQDRLAMFRTARDYWALREALVEVRVGVRGFEASGTIVRLPYRGNRSMDALDRLLDLSESLDSLSDVPEPTNVRLREWMLAEGPSQPWFAIPAWAREAFRDYVRNLLANYPGYLSDDVTIAGVPIGDLKTFWVELLAWGMHMHAATMMGSGHLPTICPLLPKDALIEVLVVATGLSPYVVGRIVALLTLDVSRCSDGALTPLVPIDERIVAMSSLIVPSSPQRNFLAIVQLNPSLVGEAGRLLGREGEAAARTLLSRLRPDILVDGRIKVLRPDGSAAGDFDVVACDPAKRTAVIFEIRWGIAADGNAEVYRSERGAIEKRSQVVRLRQEVNSGRARPHWPAGWPEMSGYDYHWYVLTRDVLAMRDIADDDVTIRSYQLLRRTLRTNSSINDLISALDSPPVPPAELSRTQWEGIRYGDLRVEIESIVT